MKWRPPVSTHPNSEEQLSRDADWHLGPVPTVRVVQRCAPYVPAPPLRRRRRGAHDDPLRLPKQMRWVPPKPEPRWSKLAPETRDAIMRELAAAPREQRSSGKGGLIPRLAAKHGCSAATVYNIERALRAAPQREESAA